MKGCANLFILLFMVLLMFYLSIDDPIKPKVDIGAASTYPEVDTNRTVLRFNFEKNQWEYEDEIPKDTGVYSQKEPLPDLYVDDIKNFKTQRESRIIVATRRRKPNVPQIVTFDGKRYKINKKPNGDIEWIRIR